MMQPNPYAERIIGSIRRECFDHLIVLNEDHLRRILDSISITITTLGRIDDWSETLQRHEKSDLRQRAKSSPYHKSAAYIIGIDDPHNFVAVVGPRDNSTRIDQRLIASKVLACVSTNRASAGDSTNRDFEVVIGFGATNICCLHA